MQPTNTRDPQYYHKVVDCQWACPAHTNVPEYIRLIAAGRFTESYLLNRKSNVFPGILGRTCDRPCEPACRRTRVEDEPVAICRLKRVAADLRDDVSDFLPAAPTEKNGKKVALIGAGPASLTVANDLMPLGYEITIFEALPKAGGLMRTNIPSFRLPVRVLEEEIDYILDMGVDIRFDHRIDSMKKLLDGGEYDAVFVGTGAPKGKELNIPGRQEADANIHIGIEWLEAIHFGHVDAVGERVLVIGVGNTAMDCCRSAKRLGGKQIKVMARKSRPYFKASPWELEDAEDEQVEILVNHSPASFVVEDGRLTGMMFDLVEWKENEKGRLVSTKLDEVFIPADDVVLAIGQDNAFPWIERDIGIEFGEWDMPVVDRATFMTTREGVFVGGDAAWGPENIIWAVEHGHQAAISIHNYCEGKSVTERPPYGMNLVSTKMGIHEWRYSNDYDANLRTEMRYEDLEKRLADMMVEAELGFDLGQASREVERCLNCDIQTDFSAKLCIECDACVDICPVLCLTITHDGEEDDLRNRLTAPAENRDQALFASESLPQTGRIMVKDEDLCVHCGLCAERCPTAAWDMMQFDLLNPHAGTESWPTTAITV
ncbi:MAG: FAD-dependent oxidoreductase [Gemmatimonadota bacterium]|nr:FAD-dependent oxidoreductase [Gemmatimonadota bacterium]MDE3006516.1 FAD-dependent oxidoreductase [Gemmatimonadota bacterium]MDE3014139.1 FAD-dependent oxidoreductase [Gemmatimonadota bacterium]